MNIRIAQNILTVLVGGLFLVACSDGPAALEAAEDDVASKDIPAATFDADIVDAALTVNAQTGEFSVLIAALTRVDLASALKADGPFTVFAPTDAAFGSLLAELGATSLDDVGDETLTSVLLYHVARGEIFPSPIVGSRTITTLSGQVITVRDERSSVSLTDVNGRQASVLSDIVAANGVIHVINRVILPTLG